MRCLSTSSRVSCRQSFSVSLQLFFCLILFFSVVHLHRFLSETYKLTTFHGIVVYSLHEATFGYHCLPSHFSHFQLIELIRSFKLVTCNLSLECLACFSSRRREERGQPEIQASRRTELSFISGFLALRPKAPRELCAAFRQKFPTEFRKLGALFASVRCEKVGSLYLFSIRSVSCKQEMHKLGGFMGCDQSSAFFKNKLLAVNILSAADL